MPTTTASRRIAATFQCGRDPDQDQIVEWLKTLPVNKKGMVERSVMKYHISRALLMYIQSGKTQSVSVKTSTSVSDVPVLSNVVTPPAPVHTPPVVASTPVQDVPVAQPSAPAVTPAPVEQKPKGAGSLLRNKIAKSMSGS